MAVGFNLPDPYEAQKADIARRQKYAEILQQQAFQPIEISSYQGVQAPIPATAILAKALQGGYKGPLCGYQLLEISDADRQSLDKALAAAKITAKAILCERHASELHERISGAVASLRIPSPTYVPADVYLRSKAAVRDDRAAMRDIA